jgi:Cu/Zn superoxide dismutase
VTCRLSLDDRNGGVNSGVIPGASVIVHADEDRGDEQAPPGTPGRLDVPGAALYAGGARAACGIIEFEGRADEDDND